MRVVIDDSELRDILSRITDDRIFRTACLDSIALISQRIQNVGARTNGNPIGNYSPGYSKYRRKHGRQTSHIDITFTGETIDSLDFEKTSSNEYSIGFSNKSAADKAEWNEARFGDLFSLSEGEINLVGMGIENNVNAEIGR
jgi:hypothetical protein